MLVIRPTLGWIKIRDLISEQETVPFQFTFYTNPLPSWDKLTEDINGLVTINAP
jgi:hypothetical protein